VVNSIAPTFDGKRAIPSAAVTKIMLDMLALAPGDKVLEIGTGSGTQTKMLADTGAEIHSIELEPWLDAVDLDGKTNVYLHAGDGKIGLESEAPFSAIMATCGVENVPAEWIAQLKPSGLIVAPVGDMFVQRLTLFVKQDLELVPVMVAAYVRFQMMREKPKSGKLRYAEVS
jgi:protein-L-isoaspartate(D-aspartate) O-methyltransferase